MFIESRELLIKHKIPVSRISKYWKGLEGGIVYKTACKKCGETYYPPRAECLCGGEVEWVEVDGEGIIEAFTTVHAIPKGFEWNKPYTIAIASFGDVKIMGWAEDVEVGDRVRIKTGKDETGVWKVYFEVI
ncbi:MULTISPECIES: Zn-ribbon domain-containing OB-fold protein [unclassified Archaeoglobus]|uniref:Zn-ribbon domain-containing OB-fold protein n=1 Tax=unclassified Archaeoglobus TaxID=2643606 RepID=UPI0025C0CE7B|nr:MULTISPECIES: Zn-ribbon domain-containing OB-fold protein [unclassified Archaeoglobus]